MKASAFRKPAFVAMAAFGFSLFGSISTTYAETSLAMSVSIPDAQTASNVDPSSALTANNGVVELGGAASADAGEMALVSAATMQVELAKTPDGARKVGYKIATEAYGWKKKQLVCLNSLWTRESHWNFLAHNYYSGATGIAQALPANKMDVIATDWRTNPLTQIRWGLRYVKLRYGTPCNALTKHRWSGYY